MFLAHRQIKFIHPRAFSGCKPIIHKWPVFVMIWHQGTRLQSIDVSEHEVSDVLDLLPAYVAPEKRMSLNMSLEDVFVFTRLKTVVHESMDASKAVSPPIDAFITP